MCPVGGGAGLGRANTVRLVALGAGPRLVVPPGVNIIRVYFQGRRNDLLATALRCSGKNVDFGRSTF